MFFEKKNFCSFSNLCQTLSDAETPIQAYVSVQGWNINQLIHWIILNGSSEVESVCDRFQIRGNKEWDKLCSKLVEAETFKKQIKEFDQKEITQLALSRPTTEPTIETPMCKDEPNDAALSKQSLCRPSVSQKSQTKKNRLCQSINNQTKRQTKKYKFDKENWNKSSQINSCSSITQKSPIGHDANDSAFSNQHQRDRKNTSGESPNTPPENQFKNKKDNEPDCIITTNPKAERAKCNFASSNPSILPKHKKASEPQSSFSANSVLEAHTQATKSATHSESNSETSDSTTENVPSKLKASDSIIPICSSSASSTPINQQVFEPQSKWKQSQLKNQMLEQGHSEGEPDMLHVDHKPLDNSTDILDAPENDPFGNPLLSIPFAPMRMKANQNNLTEKTVAPKLNLNAKLFRPNKVKTFSKQFGSESEQKSDSRTSNLTLKVSPIEQMINNKSDCSATLTPTSTTVVSEINRSEMVNPSLCQLHKAFGGKDKLHINVLYLRMQILGTFFTSIEHLQNHLSQFTSLLCMSECWVELM